jgi:hypothetical protein
MAVVAELSPHPAPPLRQLTTAIRVAAPAPTAASAVAPAALELLAAPTAESTQREDLPQNGCRLADLLDANSGAERSGTLPQPVREPTRIEPLTKDLRRLHITVTRRLIDKLAAARDALSHSMPGANDDEILEAGLDLILAAQAKRKGVVAKPRKEPPPSKGDDIPAHVKRAVWIRDGGRCQYPTADGGICGSTVRVEFGHRTARALGGPATVENIRLVCHCHNEYEARLDFGDEHQDRCIRRSRARARAPDGPAAR